MIILSKLTETFYFPLFLLFLVSFFMFLKEQSRKIIISLVLFFAFSIFFRSIYTVQTRRYYSAFLLFGFVIIAYFFKSLFKYKNGFFIVLMFLVSFTLLQTVNAFTGSSNLPEYNIQESINRAKKSLNRHIFIAPKRVFRRYSSYANVETISDGAQQIEDIKKLFDKYLYTQSDFLVLNTTDCNYHAFNINGYKPENYMISLAGFVFGNKKKNHFSLYKFNHPTDAKSFLYSNSSDDLIINGNIERQISQPTIKKRYRYWAEESSDFYSTPTLLLPDLQILLAGAWRRDEVLPKVFSDDSSPISGKYSLHVSSDIPLTLYLCNRVKPCSGLLSFKVKSTNNNTSFSVNRVDYDKDNKMIYSSRFNNVFLNDDDVHPIQLYYDNSEFSGELSLFFLLIDPSDFMIDDISFHPAEL